MGRQELLCSCGVRKDAPQTLRGGHAPAIAPAAMRGRGFLFLTFIKKIAGWYTFYMLTLYVKTGCPYCELVLGVVEELGIQVEQKNIADDAVATELIQRGGKRQVPYLVDSEKNIEMYESEDIAHYLQQNYPKAQ